MIKRGRGPNEFLSFQYNGQYFIDSLGCHMVFSDCSLGNVVAEMNITQSILMDSLVIENKIKLSESITYSAESGHPFRR